MEVIHSPITGLPVDFKVDTKLLLAALAVLRLVDNFV